MAYTAPFHSGSMLVFKGLLTLQVYTVPYNIRRSLQNIFYFLLIKLQSYYELREVKREQNTAPAPTPTRNRLNLQSLTET